MDCLQVQLCVSFMGPYKRVDVVCSVEETWVSWVLIASFFSVPPHMMLMPQEALPVGYDSLCAAARVFSELDRSLDLLYSGRVMTGVADSSVCSALLSSISLGVPPLSSLHLPSLWSDHGSSKRLEPMVSSQPGGNWLCAQLQFNCCFPISEGFGNPLLSAGLQVAEGQPCFLVIFGEFYSGIQRKH